ncbi:uncharacterized protein V6R79_003566 [Siganus canaliculatus]
MGCWFMAEMERLKVLSYQEILDLLAHLELDGTAKLSPEEKRTVNELALSWDLPPVTSEMTKCSNAMLTDSGLQSNNQQREPKAAVYTIQREVMCFEDNPIFLQKPRISSGTKTMICRSKTSRAKCQEQVRFTEHFSKPTMK